MRALLLPVYEVPASPQGDSSWLWFRDLARQVDGWAEWESVDDGGVKNVTLLPPDQNARARDGMLLSREVTARYGTVDAPPVDVMVTNNPLRGLAWDRWLRDRWKGRWTPPSLVWNVSTKFFDSPEVTVYDERELPMWAMGYALMPNVMPTKFAMDRCRDVVSTYLGAPLIDAYDASTFVRYVGPDCDAIDELLTERPPVGDEIRLWYGGRFTATKMGERAVEQYVRYAMGGRNASIQVSKVGDAARLSKTLERLGAEDMVNLYAGLSWPEQIGLMSSCHVSVWWQSLEMFPSTPLEQMYAGLVVLVRADGHEKEILPPDYPFTFATPQECATLLRYVAENYDEAKAKVAHVPEFVRERYDRTKGVKEVLDIADTLALANRTTYAASYGRSSGMADTLRSIVTGLGADATMTNVLGALGQQMTAILMTSDSRAKGLLPGHVHWLMPHDVAEEGEEEPRYVC